MENKTYKSAPNDHLANERTFLSWIRTSIGIMGFGFVVVKFSLFIKEISSAINRPAVSKQTGYSHSIGITLVALGAVILLFSYLRYIKTKKQLETGQYYHSTLFIKLVTSMIFLASILLLIYLLKY